jgi:hypothetical protein
MLRNKIALSTMFTYLFFLTPKLIYELLPVSVLVAVLATFGMMSKQNEVTAFKACGVSLFRLAVPILVLRCCRAAACLPSTTTTQAPTGTGGAARQIKGRVTRRPSRPDRQ